MAFSAQPYQSSAIQPAWPTPPPPSVRSAGSRSPRASLPTCPPVSPRRLGGRPRQPDRLVPRGECHLLRPRARVRGRPSRVAPIAFRLAVYITIPRPPCFCPALLVLSTSILTGGL